LLRRLLAAAIGIGIEAEIDGARAVAQLLKLTGVEMGSHRTRDVVEAGLPQNGIVEQTFHQNHFRVSPGQFPRIQAAFGAGQETMRQSRSRDTATIEIAFQRKDDAMYDLLPIREGRRNSMGGLISTRRAMRSTHRAFEEITPGYKRFIAPSKSGLRYALGNWELG